MARVQGFSSAAAGAGLLGLRLSPRLGWGPTLGVRILVNTLSPTCARDSERGTTRPVTDHPSARVLYALAYLQSFQHARVRLHSGANVPRYATSWTHPTSANTRSHGAPTYPNVRSPHVPPNANTCSPLRREYLDLRLGTC